MHLKSGLALILSSVTCAVSFCPAQAQSRLPRGCEANEDPLPTSFDMAAGGRVTVRPQSCPVAMAAGDRYQAYLIEWRGRTAESYVFADKSRLETDSVVGIEISRGGPALIVIDEQAERGGDAILIWRAAPNRYFSKPFHYRGSDEGALSVRQVGNAVTVSFIGIVNGKSRVVGTPMRFRLDPAKGIM